MVTLTVMRLMQKRFVRKVRKYSSTMLRAYDTTIWELGPSASFIELENQKQKDHKQRLIYYIHCHDFFTFSCM
jgi:hypothetical protein